jgi:molybdate transport system substrate-binding protein
MHTTGIHRISLKRLTRCAVIALVLPLSTLVYADTLKAAVASNALKAMNEIGQRFEKQSGNTLLISAGSTSKLYTQILNGAPFDLFLAANVREPAKLEKAGLIVPGSRFTYAVGRLALYSKNPTAIGKDGAAYLQSGKYQRLAIANPEIAPYGHAAQEVLQSLGLWQSLEAKLVRGQNIGQAFQFTVTGNADAGFVAWSDVKQLGAASGSAWLIPQKLYSPLQQQAVILKRCTSVKTAQAFVSFLRSPAISKLLEDKYGYGVE